MTQAIKSSRGGIPASTRTMVCPPALVFYVQTLRALDEAEIPFVVGGTFALRHFAGIARGTKDLDIFLKKSDVERALAALRAKGFKTDLTFPHWLAKAHCGEHFVDFIFSSANGLCAVDDDWFSKAPHGVIFGEPVRLCPIEEVIWSKSFVMERERFDGADIYHLIEAKGGSIDWKRLLDRFGAHWRVLYGHLVLYSFVYPGERNHVPGWVMDELAARMKRERAAEHSDVCNGTLLSREQYLIDLNERGYEDARVEPIGACSQKDIDSWTDAIGKIK